MNECRSALVTARWCRLFLAVANEACKSAPGGGETTRAPPGHARAAHSASLGLVHGLSPLQLHQRSPVTLCEW